MSSYMMKIFSVLSTAFALMSLFVLYVYIEVTAAMCYRREAMQINAVYATRKSAIAKTLELTGMSHRYKNSVGIYNARIKDLYINNDQRKFTQGEVEPEHPG